MILKVLKTLTRCLYQEMTHNDGLNCCKEYAAVAPTCKNEAKGCGNNSKCI